MKHGFRDYIWVKVLAMLLFLAVGTAACLGCCYCFFYWDSLEGDYTHFPLYYQAKTDALNSLKECLNYQWRINHEEDLTYLEQISYHEQKAALAADATNFRYIVRSNTTGEIVVSSLGENSLDGALDIQRFQFPWGTEDADETQEILAVESGIDSRLEVNDAFRMTKVIYAQGNQKYFYLTGAFAVLAILLLVFLMSCAGRRRGQDNFVLNWQDKIPYDLYLCVMGGAVAVGAVVSVEILGQFLYQYLTGFARLNPSGSVYLLLAEGAMVGTLGLTAAMAMSTASRWKAGVLFRNTLIWRLCGLIRRLWRRLLQTCCRFWQRTRQVVSTLLAQSSLTGRLMTVFAGYLLLNGILGMTFFPGYLVLNGAVAVVLIRWTLAWGSVRAGVQAIVSGCPDVEIRTSEMQYFPSLCEHARQLNDLSSAINTAVEERMKSERMKAELITNVSHDLKTPLTSIINYVDLLKKEDVGSEKAREYLAVLDRKSQRLKKLTEDLVEASKASTGALTVNLERVGIGQLMSQAMGEYEEKLTAASLTLIPTLPEREVYVPADGRYLWRVMDNLLGNCVKYALPGTRVYLDVLAWDGKATISIKNISANQLNIPPETLMERFVRGDESRTTEGSGLGLSIARSLTELQGGTFRLDIDGDLFKVVVTLPQME